MAIPANRTTFTFNHSDQVDNYGPTVGGTTVKTNFDSRAEENLQDINNLKDALVATTDGDSGADGIRMTPITDVDATAETVQSIVEAFVARLRATTDGDSGADFIKATAIAGLAGGDVQTLLESVKTALDTINANGWVTNARILNDAVTADKIATNAVTETKISANAVVDSKIGNRTVDDGTAPLADAGTLTVILGYLANRIKAITGKADWKTDPQKTIDELQTEINDIIAGAVPDGSITNTKLATDVKVGSLATLTTTEKSSVVGAMNEIVTDITTIEGQISANAVASNLYLYANIGGAL